MKFFLLILSAVFALTVSLWCFTNGWWVWGTLNALAALMDIYLAYANNT